jgi:putative NADH-flavin reductase
MKIGIIAASGQAGSLIMKEALQRGHAVTAIVRHPEKVQVDVPVIQKDLFDLTTADLQGFDVVVDAFRAPEGHEDLFITSTKHLIEILKETAVRLLVVGGAGSLYVDDHITHLYETASFPDLFKPTAVNMAEALTLLEDHDDVQWTYLSPAANFQADAPRTGHYVLGNEMLMTDQQGKSQISYADYAIAMVDEIEQDRHRQEHLSVIG